MEDFDVIVQGYSTSVEDWAKANRVPGDSLPQLTEGQKAFARKFGVKEEDFARSVLAGRYGSKRLVADAERFAFLFREVVAELAKQNDIRIVQVFYSAFDRRFTCHLREGSKEFSIEMSSALVADHLDSGAPSLREDLKRLLAEKIEQARTHAVGVDG
jgi:hypothetical protein